MRHEYNLATAEIDLQDTWQQAVLACVTVSNDAVLNRKLLQQVLEFIERTWPDIEIRDHRIEML